MRWQGWGLAGRIAARSLAPCAATVVIKASALIWGQSVAETYRTATVPAARRC